jgi:hypothetical protein
MRQARCAVPLRHALSLGSSRLLCQVVQRRQLRRQLLRRRQEGGGAAHGVARLPRYALARGGVQAQVLRSARRAARQRVAQRGKQLRNSARKLASVAAGRESESGACV